MQSVSSSFLRRTAFAALTAGVLTLLAFGPITGLVLDGYSLSFEPYRPIFLALLVIAARFVMDIAKPLFASRGERQTVAGARPEMAVGWLDKLKEKPALLASSLALIFLLAAVYPFFASKYWLTVLILAMIYVMLGLGLNIVVGLAGLLDLGFVGFYAVGAYGYALGAQYAGLGFWSAMPLVIILASTAGVVLAFPVLRMHGDYLAIVTLGFGEIIRLILNNWLDVTGGPNGVQVPAPTFFGYEFTRIAKYGGTPIHEALGVEYASEYRYIFVYLVLLIFVTTILFGVNRLQRMPIGRAWEALREDEIACRSLGLNHVTTKLSAFAMGATIAGLAGVFFASYQGFVNPTSFSFFESALILAIVVLGGMGSTLGVVLAALFLTLAPEFLRDFAQYRVLVFGILMVLIMIWKPRGLVQARRPQFPGGGQSK